MNTNSAVTITSHGTTIKNVGETMNTKEITTITSETGDILYIWRGIAEDAKGLFTPITLEYTKTEAGFTLTKKIPMEWLKNATYPVKTDATVSYFSEWADGFLQNYIESGSYSQGSWDTVHDASTGYENDTSTSADIGEIYDRSGAYKIVINRAFFPFDTSGLPDSASISAATLKLYLSQQNDDVNDSDSYIVVVQTTQASTSALVSGDFDQA